MPTAFVSGALANKPFNGGNAWTRLAWLLGLQRLGWDVYFVEQIEATSGRDDAGAVVPIGRSVQADYFRLIMGRFGLVRSSGLLTPEGESVCGLGLTELCTRAGGADLLINISGHLTHPDIKGPIRCKVYYDDDPGYTQLWHAMGDPAPRLENHDFHYTAGGNIGTSACALPTGGITWRHTRPPVVLDQWPTAAQGVFERFTTVASWRGAYAPIEYRGRRYGLKAHEFRKFIGLPRSVDRPFEIALQIDPGDHRDLEALSAHGWRVLDPKPSAGTPEGFRRYLQSSSAEFSVAQGIYVDTQCGWFSDRTVRYLACGKPAVVQDTGFRCNYPTGSGLIAFRTFEEAVTAVENIVADYPCHCRAARELAETCFESDRVIRRLLQEVGVDVASRAGRVQPACSPMRS